MGIEAMFKDYKTGGYNLESAKANETRLNNLILLIAISYTISSFQGVRGDNNLTVMVVPSNAIKNRVIPQPVSATTPIPRNRGASDFWMLNSAFSRESISVDSLTVSS